MKQFFLIAALACAPVLAMAEDAPATLPPDSLAPPTCEQPPMPNDNTTQESNEATRTKHVDPQVAWQKKFDAYRKCIQDYVSAQNDLQKAHVAAANAAIKGLNDYIAKLNAANGN